MLTFRSIGSLTTPVLDRLGDWNPQLLRELKGRLRRFSVLTAIGLSLLVQVIVLFCFINALPGVDPADLELTTYPQINLSPAVRLPDEVYEKVMPTNWSERTVIRQRGLFIENIAAPAVARGGYEAGQFALQQLRVGDRLVALNGVPIEQLEKATIAEITGNPASDWQGGYRLVHEENVANLIRGTEHQQLSTETLPLIHSTVELTLYRPDRGQFTVQVSRIAISNKRADYCLTGDTGERRCQLSVDKLSYQIDWPQWHQNIFITLSGLMTLCLIGFGIFLLTNNLVEEQRRGTLNFLRMSPRSALTILGGKLAGVPICLYLAIAAMVPFQIYAGLSAGFNGVHLIGFNIALLSQTIILYAAALLLGLATRAPMLMSLIPWLAAAGGLGFQFLVGVFSLARWDSNIPMPSTPLDWAVLFSPLGSACYFIDVDSLIHSNGLNLPLSIFRVNFVEYTLLTVLHACGWCVLLGHALQRRFEHSTKSLLARRYSYLLTGLFMFIVLGLSETQVEGYDLLPLLSLIAILCLLYSLLLVLSLSCDRQTLQDWARFRTARMTHEGRLPLWQDLLVGDTSSPIIGMGLNLLLMATLFAAWFMLCYRHFLNNELDLFGLVGSILMLIGSIFFAAMASQVLLLAKRQKSWFWFGSISSVSCLLFPSLSLAIGIGLTPASLNNINVLGLPPEVAMFVIPLSLMGSLITILAGIHWRQFAVVGRSEWRIGDANP